MLDSVEESFKGVERAVSNWRSGAVRPRLSDLAVTCE